MPSQRITHHIMWFALIFEFLHNITSEESLIWQVYIVFQSSSWQQGQFRWYQIFSDVLIYFVGSQGFQSGPHSNVSIQHSRHDHKHTQKLWTFLPKVDLICFEKFESFLLFFLYLIFDMACLKVRTSEWYNGGGGDEGQVEKRRNIILMQRFINMSLWVQCKCGPRYDLDIINKMWMEGKYYTSLHPIKMNCNSNSCLHQYASWF